MQDTNGNQILIRYYAGNGVTWTNSSARIRQIEDVRAVAGVNSMPYYTYNFLFNSDPIPHLTGIVNGIGTGEKYLFTYSTGSLIAPFSGAQNFGGFAHPAWPTSRIRNGPPGYRYYAPTNRNCFWPARREWSLATPVGRRRLGGTKAGLAKNSFG